MQYDVGIMMPFDLLSGILQVAPVGPQEWDIAFLPTADIPRGTTRYIAQSTLIEYLQELGVTSERIEEIANFDFSRDDLRVIDFAFVNISASLLRRLGLISDRHRRN